MIALLAALAVVPIAAARVADRSHMAPAEACVKKVAVFGNAGGGKSALARKLAEVTRIPLYVVDMMQFRAGGVAVPHEEHLKAHAELLQRDAWIGSRIDLAQEVSKCTEQ